MITNDQRTVILLQIYREICQSVKLTQENEPTYQKCAAILEDCAYRAAENNHVQYQHFVYSICAYMPTIITANESPVEYCQQISIHDFTSLDPESFARFNVIIQDRVKNSKIEAAIVTYKTCPSCGERQAQRITAQTRAADEAETVTFSCMKCSRKFR
jgi:DNA-directed RNA polymerase subunit M/transcription elongation factor TFIIS